MSVELFFSNPECRRKARDGPLADDIDAFAVWLAAEGYAPSTARQKLHLAADVSRWLASQELAVDDLNDDQVVAFHAVRKPQQRRLGDAATGRQLLDLLRATGRVPTPHSGRDCGDPVERAAQTYERFLLDERGVKPSTAQSHLPKVRRFLSERFGGQAITLASLSAQGANQFILREAQRLGSSRAKRVATILPSFLRHLQQRGAIPADLSGAIPPVRDWSLAGLPKALKPEEVRAILFGCDRNTMAGRRDYAILLLLARLGLRGGEVSELTLDDFDWNAGIVNVSGKGQRRKPLPLPCDVGEAVAGYLALPARGRLELDHRICSLPRPDLAHVVPHAAVAARVSRCPHLLIQPPHRQLRIHLQARLDVPLERVQLVLDRRPRPPSAPGPTDRTRSSSGSFAG